MFPWLEKARSNETMSQNILKQLERIKQLHVVQDKITINSWDFNYAEQVQRFSQRQARFVVEEDDPADQAGNRSRQQRKKITKRQTTSSLDLSSVIQSGIKQPKKKFKEIIIDECDPDRLEVSEPDDGEKLFFGPPIDKKALYSSINLP